MRVREETAVAQSNPLPFDTSVPNPARMWNYWVGGKDNYAADRQAAEQIMATMPQLPVIARMVRRFLINAVHELAAEHGIRQFLGRHRLRVTGPGWRGRAWQFATDSVRTLPSI